MDATFALGIAWFDDQRFWVGFEDGVALVNADALATETSLGAASPAVEMLVSGIPEGFEVDVDPLTGSCWINGNTNRIDRVDIDGTHRTWLDVEKFYFVDGAGGLWGEANGTWYRASNPARDRIAAVFSPSDFGNEIVDRMSGGLWTPTIIPPGLLAVAEDGDTAEFIDRVTIDGVPEQQTPLLFTLRPSVDPRTIWAFGVTDFTDPSTGRVYRVDVSRRPVSFTTVLSPPVVFEIGDLDLFAAGHTRAWIGVDQLDGSIHLTTMTTSGNFSGASPLVLPGDRDGVRAAILPASEDLCLATSDFSTIRLRGIDADDPAGAPLFDATLTFGTNGQYGVSVAATADASGERCWFAWSVAPSKTGETCSPADGTPSLGITTVVAWDPQTGTQTLALVDSGGRMNPDSLFVPASDTVWYGSDRCIPSTTSLGVTRAIVPVRSDASTGWSPQAFPDAGGIANVVE